MFKIDVKKYEAVIGAIGNIMTWYDFALVMPLTVVLMSHFFPEDSSAMVKALGGLIVSMGLFSRPFGAMIFGPIGDKFGRQKAISLSVLLMAIPTVIIGLTPSYEKIGVCAPLIIIICRILQGISMGGEYTSAMVHLVEKAPSDKRGFYGSWTDVGNQVGVLLSGQSVIWLYSFFSEDAVYSFAWRIPFLCGILLVPFAFLVPKQEQKKKDDANKPSVLSLLIEHKTEVFCTMAITAFSAIGFYTLWTFLPYYLVSEQLMSLDESAFCGVMASLMSIVSIFGGGYLSDKYGRKPFLICGIIGTFVVCSIMFIFHMKSFYYWLVLELLFGFFLGLYYASRAAFFSEAFPSQVRCTAVSVSLSFAQAVFGGLTPVIMLWLINLPYHVVILPILITSIAALIALALIEDRTGKQLL